MSAAAEIAFDHVTKRYAGRDSPAVEDLTFEIPAGALCMLVGPSGGGKTTTLKMINRLIPFDSGDIRIDGRSVRDIPATQLRRGIGYVIQQVGLFPHMNVGDNIATVPNLLGWTKRRTQTRIAELLELVGLHVADARRYPAELSGGQRQRVGLARALAADPPLLLMDEPFGALDPVLRVTIQDEFLAISRRLGKTILFVTHDVTEAFLLGDRIGVMHAGRLVRLGTPAEILDSPGESLVERFLGRHRRFLAELLAERKEKEKQWTS